ncbi:Na(+)/H(+) antiporter NhaC [Sporomusa silvacetica DSM 10669]|uniref:Na(+)/H(+) antiporter NhaC n=1 Tax=Sporomusa silvacetica DSM 10669 TaxID=1123289 RepID=A0ABZ3ITN4_9FIRM|nr:Na+/H+ antiporter NhaC family protein [Sporomusa silvacetica]OZC19595.1 Na(+)/H(+) antiporter NhaC [Sporomusa silvacetica DSM 10669]
MDTIVVFALFFTSLLVCIYNGVSILYPLFFGLGCFTWVALRRGYAVIDLLKMMGTGSKKSLIVIKIFVLIGIITAVWRASGTISFIVYYGIAFMSAKYFILSAFLLSCLVSFLLGTSFGTVGTIGVVLIVLAKSGNVDINMAAGAIIAGAYFGDRCSPMSSSANLVAALTNTKLYINLTNMTKTSIIPFILSIVGYIYLSYGNPLAFYNNQIVDEIVNSFNISLLVLSPAVIILLLAAFRIDVKLSMSISILFGILIALFVQNIPFFQLMKYIITGYSMDKSGFFAEIIQGGGLYSMLSVSLIVLISSAYAGIFQGTGLLREIEGFFEKLSTKTNVYFAMILSSIATAGFACNQTLAVMLSHQITHKLYEKNHLSNYRLALDLENTVIMISALIPWNIAGAVPAVTLSADAGFIIYAFYIFLVPLTNLLTQTMMDRKQ